MALEFLALAFEQPLPTALVPIGTVTRQRPSVLGLMWDLLGRAVKSAFAPPVFLGPLTRFGSRQVHLDAFMPAAESGALFLGVRARHPRATWNGS